MGTSRISVEAVGYAGQTCTNATAGIIAALGGAAQEEKKPEFYEELPDIELKVKEG